MGKTYHSAISGCKILLSTLNLKYTMQLKLQFLSLLCYDII